VFSWKNNEKELFSNGVLLKVDDSSIIIRWHGMTQAYSLESLTTVRELPRKNGWDTVFEKNEVRK